MIHGPDPEAHQDFEALIHGPDPDAHQDFEAFLSILAVSLFGVFVVTAVASALPLQLLNPSWQLRFGTALIDNGPIAAVGVLSAWLASLLSPAPSPHHQRLLLIRRLALAAALGYLLLIPLQATAAWRGLEQVLAGERQQTSQLRARVDGLAQVVRAAPSVEALQQQWGLRQGPSLSPDDLALPLPRLRPLLLSRLQQLEIRLRAASRAEPMAPRLWGVAQNTLRLCLSALFLALGFAAAAQARPGGPTLLLQWQWSCWRILSILSLRGGSAGRRTRLNRKGFEDADYFEEISSDD